MRPYQIFASMEPAAAEHFFQGLAEGAPAMHQQLVHAAAAAMKSRPSYVNKLAPEKKAAAMRRALARVGSDPLAEEMLAIYFLEVKQELLTAWLDAVGLEHEDGTLKEDAPAEPKKKKLEECVAAFREGDDSDRPRTAAQGLRRAEFDRLAESRRPDRRLSRALRAGQSLARSGSASRASPSRTGSTRTVVPSSSMGAKCCAGTCDANSDR